MPVAQGQDPLKIDLKMEILMLFELKKTDENGQGTDRQTAAQTDGHWTRGTKMSPKSQILMGECSKNGRFLTKTEPPKKYPQIANFKGQLPIFWVP